MSAPMTLATGAARWDNVEEAHAEALLVAEFATWHSKDEHCTVLATGVCFECDAFHGDPCPECGGAAFHRDGCSEIEDAR